MSGESGIHSYGEIMMQFAAPEATLNEVPNHEQSVGRYLREEALGQGGAAACGDIQKVEGLSCRH